MVFLLKKLTTDRFLKISLIIGGVYDLILGINLLFIPDILIYILDLINFSVSKPENMLFVQTSALFLIAVGYMLLYAAYYAPVKFAFIGMSSAVIRLGYALIVLFTAATKGVEPGFLLTAITDSLTGLLLILALIMTEGVSWKQLCKYSPSNNT